MICMNYDDLTNPKLKAIIDGLKYNSMSIDTYISQALAETEYEKDFIGDAKGFLDELCNEIKELKQALTEADNEITIYMEGGVMQDITGIPEGTTVKVVDWDIDGIEENRLTKLEAGMALVSEWKPDGSAEFAKPQ